MPQLTDFFASLPTTPAVPAAALPARWPIITMASPGPSTAALAQVSADMGSMYRALAHARPWTVMPPPNVGSTTVAAAAPIAAVAIPLAVSTAPSLTLAQAHQALAQAPTSSAAASFVSGTATSAAAGHPLGQANQAVLDLARRLQIQAAYVGKYLGHSQAAQIAAGLHMTFPMQTPKGTGLYDPDLPLYLEQTVTAMKNTNRDPVQLQQLSAALYER